MTAIAFRKGVLAATSGAYSGHSIQPFTNVNVGRLPGGRIYACCGSTTLTQGFLKYLQAPGSPRPSLGSDNQNSGVVLVVYNLAGGFAIEYNWQGELEMKGFEFLANGSAYEAVLGALYAGADAKGAVRVAQKVHAWAVAGKITSIKF